jgi:glycosyltransferase involved in cell wall biosynthesis
MKILIDATCLVEKTTGVGRYAFCLIQGLANVDNQNQYTVLLNRKVGRNHPVWAIQSENFHLLQTNLSSVGPRRQLFFALKYAHFNFDVFHCLNNFSPIFHRYNSIITLHDIRYVRYKGFLAGKSRLKIFYLRHIIKKGIEKSTKVIAVSNHSKNEITNYLKIDNKKIAVIPEAPNFSLKSPSETQTQRKILKTYSIHKPYFLVLGEKRPHKNIEGAVRAFEAFKDKYDLWNTQLVITGSFYSNYRDYLKMVDNSHISESIVFTDFVPDDHLKELYSQASIFIFVSFYEGFGLPILEAMQLGAPVITSNISSMPEVAGDAALLVDPYNFEEIAQAMFQIMNSKQLKETLVQKGYARSQIFSWDDTAKQTIKVYKEVAQTSME